MKPQTELQKLITKIKLNNGLSDEDYSEYLELQNEVGKNISMNKLSKKIRVAFNCINSGHKSRAEKAIYKLLRMY